MRVAAVVAQAITSDNPYILIMTLYCLTEYNNNKTIHSAIHTQDILFTSVHLLDWLTPY